MSLLTEQEIEDVAIFVMNADTFDMKKLGHDFARAIESAVIAKIKAQGPSGFVKAPEAVCRMIPLYKLPEGN